MNHRPPGGNRRGGPRGAAREERVAVVLYTADLRVHDHPPLRSALAEADRVVPLFVRDPAVDAAGFAAPNRLAFLADALADLDAALRERGGRLVFREGPLVPEVLAVAAEAGADDVHMAAGVSRFAAEREERLRRALESAGRRLRVHDAVCTVLEPGAVTPSGKDHFAVFTPYFRRWSATAPRAVLGAPRSVPVPDVGSAPLPSPQVAGRSPGLAPGGESAGRERWRRWLADGVDDYEDRHDDLAGDATSRLSPYLHFGCLSAVESAERARRRGGAGAEAFVRQLAWRDFHHQVLAARPRTAFEDYRERGDRWRGEGPEVEAWRAGRTGYPIVDAAMRQLLHEGWMHNRGRLLAASFLTKTLYVDWRIGAAHFLGLLVDGDVANNQLNWQWVAGTGTDTRPNRVLNPLAQARRFDPNGDYVRRWVPELADAAALPGGRVHQPWKAADGERPDYPGPIVSLDEGSARFRDARHLD
ncbi:cryptochrome/photolyase family protein [Streptomyces alkaliterrae]|uniref:Deoxyribodipyrimidine photo-lyase n=2 Tax=Streptomyces alkaliterrae TaxID=2213162 RepID=A0A7W3WSH7_9ACTN|nr:deoxyribodipyrimidine photo-lyase [Streptomyces alkaliterrae]MBB1257704.1 deoxyribodipyrimidine photo-lyase [Streptomyces alkaliterrae]